LVACLSGDVGESGCAEERGDSAVKLGTPVAVALVADAETLTLPTVSSRRGDSASGAAADTCTTIGFLTGSGAAEREPDLLASPAAPAAVCECAVDCGADDAVPVCWC
jgi:hypothetical protein